MSRRITAVLVIAAASIAPIASAAQNTKAVKPTAKTESHAKAAVVVSPTLAELYKHSDEVVKHENGMLMAEPTLMHVMLVTVDADGHAAGACADNAKSAQTFLNRAASTKETRGGKKAK